MEAISRTYFAPWGEQRLSAALLERHCARCRVLDLPYDTTPAALHAAMAKDPRREAAEQAAQRAALALPQMFNWVPDDYSPPGADPFRPLMTSHHEHFAFWGGRGGMKSWGVADAIIELASTRKERIAGAREHMVRIKESSKELLDEKARGSRWAADWQITEYELKNTRTGSVIFFVGLSGGAAGPEGVAKALEGITLLWTDEAQLVSQRSIDVILPTIRKAGSRCVWSWNPGQEPSPVDLMFRHGQPPERSLVTSLMLEDNPYIYRSRLMSECRSSFARGQADTYRHVWRGAHLEVSDATVFPKFSTGYFDWRLLPCMGGGPHVHKLGGMDFGYGGPDPSAAVGVYLIMPAALPEQYRDEDDAKPILYFATEAVAPNVPNHDLWKLAVKTGSHEVLCDSANPLMISALNASGKVAARPAVKGPGSLHAGIRKIQSCALLVSPDCPVALDELKGLRWVTDKTGKVVKPLRTIGEDHCIAAARYALSDIELSTLEGTDVDYV